MAQRCVQNPAYYIQIANSARNLKFAFPAHKPWFGRLYSDWKAVRYPSSIHHS